MGNPQIRFTPIKLPAQASYEARLNNILLNKTTGFGFSLDDEQLFHFQLQPGDLSIQHACPVSLTLEIGNTTAGLWLSGWPMEEQIRQFVPHGLLRELPENLAISIIENALTPLLQEAEKALELKISIQSTSAEPHSPLYAMPLGFRMQTVLQKNNAPIFTGFGLLLLDPQLYPYLQERLGHWPSETNLDWDEHHTPLRLEISRIIFSMQEVNQLEPSDLILLEETRFVEDGLLRLRLDSGYYCEATLNRTQQSNLTVNSEWMPMSNNEQKQNIEHISQIPVQLSFDLGEKTLSFNEVRQLHPGYILELGKSLPEIVQIRSQHRLIGTGELVEINGRVGVRILNLFNKKAKASQ
ncbi:type III secretion system cytoplasmic ring protein SctQ [Candidatus Thiothrix sp. Deng01]|uniref:Type III secretion system cytoplasmic ring protein SctQ n=1 Tax=Candidatus Thiothrix phosphatis TaxID=3112415 RepID=A0ABU6CRF3_9GAMM|nr:type III secretion system cytoplasmic ring protein SctQ [Candidatus Thiothrix sp. Deng01]MEB4589421.1 type III secretion system cytoplasmic ring protein SctQ [Candidatus Thiothrix sp. Deng01]